MIICGETLYFDVCGMPNVSSREPINMKILEGFKIMAYIREICEGFENVKKYEILENFITKIFV